MSPYRWLLSLIFVVAPCLAADVPRVGFTKLRTAHGMRVLLAPDAGF